jgi:hypothetical protein
MPKIPGIIDQMQNVAGPTTQQRASEDTFSPGWRQADSALRSVGDAEQDTFRARERAVGAKGQIGDALQNTGEFLWKQHEAARQNDAQATLAKGQMDWTNHLAERLRNPPRTADGSLDYANITQDTLDEFDKYADGVLERAQTTRERSYLQKELNDMRANLGVRAMTGQAHLAGVAASESYAKVQTSLSSSTYTDQTMLQANLDQGMRAIESQVALHALAPDVEAKLRSDMQHTLTTSALQAELRDRPKWLEAQLKLPIDQRDASAKVWSQYAGGELEAVFANKAESEVKQQERQAKVAKIEAHQVTRDAQDKTYSDLAVSIRDGLVGWRDSTKKVDLGQIADSGALGPHTEQAIALLDAASKKDRVFVSDPAVQLKLYRVAIDEDKTPDQKNKIFSEYLGKGSTPSDDKSLRSIAAGLDKQDSPYLKQLDFAARKALLGTMSISDIPHDPALVKGYTDFQFWKDGEIARLREGGMKMKDIIAPDGPIMSAMPGFRSDRQSLARKAAEAAREVAARAKDAKLKTTLQTGPIGQEAPSDQGAANEMEFWNALGGGGDGFKTAPAPGLVAPLPNTPADFPKMKPGESGVQLMERIRKYKAEKVR